MYLVHVQLKGPPGQALPEHTAQLVLTHAEPQDRLEHVSAHPGASPHPVLGLFLLAADLDEAERHADLACRRALARCPSLRQWRLVSAQVPLIAPFL
ncbi:hypothetical protein [Streptomyces sp. R35]|uniref:YCII-related domain-containing protein n=1 Tax=Streptomyces sp. R35 TaxID=3238630 RepID=A0AB39SAF1_9ACTN